MKSETVQINFRADIKMVRDLRKVARKQQRSVAGTIRTAIQEHIDKATA